MNNLDLELQLAKALNRIKLLEEVIRAVTDLLANAKAYDSATAKEEQPIQWVNVIEVECADFWSNTSKSRRPMWRLRTDDGRKFNLFDHSDPLRDDKDVLEEAVYLQIFKAMEIGEIDRWTTSPIQVELRPDGSFWKIVKMKKRADGAQPDFTGDDDDEPEPYTPPRRMFSGSPYSEIDLKEQLFDLKKAAGHYDTGEGLELEFNDSALARLIRVVKRGNFVILDTETTGLGTDAEICQIAIISPTGEKLLDTFVKPKRPIPSDATRIHGITNDMVNSARSWMDTGPNVWDLITGLDVIVYNAEYDFRLMVQSEKAHEPFVSLEWDTISRACAMEAYAEHAGDWNEYQGSYKWHKLTNAAAKVGFQLLDGVTPHSAFGDCLMTLAVCRYLVDLDQ